MKCISAFYVSESSVLIFDDIPEYNAIVLNLNRAFVVFKCDSHDDTAVQPPVSGIILQYVAESIYFEKPVPVGRTGVVIIRDAAGCLSATPQAMYGPAFSEVW